MKFLPCILIVGIVLSAGCGPEFSENELDYYEQAVVDCDEELKSQLYFQLKETSRGLLAMRLIGQGTDPVEIWKELRPLLEKGKPTPADFAKMSEHILNLMCLADLHETEEAGFDAFDNERIICIQEPRFDELSSKIGAWKYRLRASRGDSIANRRPSR